MDTIWSFIFWILISVFQGGNPLMGHEINLVGHDEHLKEWDKKQNMEIGLGNREDAPILWSIFGARILISWTFQVCFLHYLYFVVWNLIQICGYGCGFWIMGSNLDSATWRLCDMGHLT